MIKCAWYVALATALSVAVSQADQAVAEDSFSVGAVPVEAPPAIDGTLKDPAWQKGAHVTLTWDFSFQRAASEPTDVYLLTDKKYLYVAFVAKQSEPITATQRTNDIGLGTDDVVRVYFWPGGDKGFEYFFAANPIGTRYAYSSENTTFSPTWVAIAKQTSDGYIVTERIPFGIMRSDGRSTWRLQFDRRVQVSERLFEWAHAKGQTSTDSSFYTGYLENMNFVSASTRTKPRLAIYSLGEAASAGAGGSTSRMGADFSLPVTPTSSFLGTLHPDYSNVELDQQTISPTAFQRQFQEVRPFFTQGTNVYNDFNCDDCTIYPWLYTPNIPTPAEGFAFEGVQWSTNLAAFVSHGPMRTDSAESAFWSTPNHQIGASVLHELVDSAGQTDDFSIVQVRAGDVHNFSLYASGGIDRGSNVGDPAQGNYQDFGVNLYTPKSGIFAAYRWVGAEFNPIDAFVPINDTTGPSLYADQEWDFGSGSTIRKLTLSQDLQHYRNRLGQLDDADDISNITIDTKQQLTLTASMGSSWLLLNGEAGNTTQNGVNLTYLGQTNTPSTFSHNYGRYGAGYLHSTVRTTTIKLGPRATGTLEADDTDYRLDTGTLLTQWLERASYAYEIGTTSSLSVGIRRIIGTGPYFGTTPQFIDASNISFAYYRKFGHAEAYLVYGNPNSVATQPSLILKLIYYVGAEKGT